MPSDPFLGNTLSPVHAQVGSFPDGVGTFASSRIRFRARRTVDINIERKLTNFDLGINGGEISPDGKQVRFTEKTAMLTYCLLKTLMTNLQM